MHERLSKNTSRCNTPVFRCFRSTVFQVSRRVAEPRRHLFLLCG